jgi:hypothetical protein
VNDWTARIDFTDTAAVRAQLEATNAFAEEGGTQRLQLPPLRHYYAAEDALPVNRVRSLDESVDPESEQRIAEQRRMLDASLNDDAEPDHSPTLDS